VQFSTSVNSLCRVFTLYHLTPQKRYTIQNQFVKDLGDAELEENVDLTLTF
jgi:hypothetical protein